jgi:transcriptional regulator with XRE-family HTH domain
MVRQRVGPTLRAMRLRKRLSLNELAERAGISPSHLSRIERGLTVPSYDVLDNIATALGSDLNSLRSREKSARAVDDELRRQFDKLELSDDAQQELLGLGNETREALADGLGRLLEDTTPNSDGRERPGKIQPG